MWDGVTRELEVAGYLHKHGSVSMMTEVRGKIAAVSLHLAIYDTTGTRVFDSFGGLDLVHEIDIGTPGRADLENRPSWPTWQFRLKRARLRDPVALREGVAMAFTPYLDPPALDPPAPAAAPVGGEAP